MADPVSLHHALDERTATCSVVVVKRRPRRSFAATRAVSADLSSWLPDGAAFALNLCMAPATRAPDGAPLDILVLGDQAPATPVLRVRLIGVLQADHTERGHTRSSDHAVAVVEASRRFAAVREIEDLGEARLQALRRAWSAYNAQRVASFQVVSHAGAAVAVRLVGDCSVREARPASPARLTAVSRQ